MNETQGALLGVFVILALASSRVWRENQRLKAENRVLKNELRNVQDWYVAMMRRCKWLQSELGATEDAAEERETP